LSANLRSVLVVVIAMTTLSLVYAAPLPLLALNAFVLLLLATAPGILAGSGWLPDPWTGPTGVGPVSGSGIISSRGNRALAMGWLRFTEIGLESGLVSGLRLLLLLLAAGLLFDYPFTRWLQALRPGDFPTSSPSW
jgi:hypothetical protein